MWESVKKILNFRLIFSNDEKYVLFDFKVVIIILEFDFLFIYVVVMFSVNVVIITEYFVNIFKFLIFMVLFFLFDLIKEILNLLVFIYRKKVGNNEWK